MLVFYDLISNYIFVKNVFIREGQTSSKILSTILIFFRGILGFSTGFFVDFPPKVPTIFFNCLPLVHTFNDDSVSYFLPRSNDER